MRKLLFFTFFFLLLTVNAQDTTHVAVSQKIDNKNLAVDTADVKLRAFQSDFKKNYTDSDFIYEFKTPEKNAWDRFKEWLANIFKNLFDFTDDEASMTFVSYLLKTIAELIVLFVIYLIVKALMNKEGRWIFGKSSDQKVIHYDEIERNLHAIDFEKLIKGALESDEKRLVIRYYYLWYLKKLSDRQLIQWDIEKTNSDYLYELKSQTLREKFSYLSYLYDYIWYGEFELDDTTFPRTKSTFENAIKTVSHE